MVSPAWRMMIPSCLAITEKVWLWCRHLIDVIPSTSHPSGGIEKTWFLHVRCRYFVGVNLPPFVLLQQATPAVGFMQKEKKKTHRNMFLLFIPSTRDETLLQSPTREEFLRTQDRRDTIFRERGEWSSMSKEVAIGLNILVVFYYIIFLANKKHFSSIFTLYSLTKKWNYFNIFNCNNLTLYKTTTL